DACSTFGNRRIQIGHDSESTEETSMFRAWLVGLVLLIGVAAPLAAAELTIIDNGQSKAAVFVPERLWDDAAKNPEPPSVCHSLKPEDNRRRLRESVKDFVGVIERMSGAKLPVEVSSPKAGDARVAILVGELASAKFGAP